MVTESEATNDRLEGRFQAVFEAAAMGAALSDLDGRILEANAALQCMLGYSAAELRGMSFQDFTHPEDAAKQQVLFDELVAGRRESYQIEKRYIVKTGEVLWVRLTESMSRTGGGEPWLAVSMVEDISHHRAVEETLRARERQQAALSALGRQALSTLDLQELMDSLVRTVSRVLGLEFCNVLEHLPGGDFLMRAGTGWSKGVVGSAIVPGGTFSQAGYALVAGAPVVVEDLPTETRFQPNDLALSHGVRSGVAVPIHAQNGPFGVFGALTAEQRTFTADDVHFIQSCANVLALAIDRQRIDAELQRSRDQLQLIFQNVADGITVQAPDGELLFANAAAARFLGFESSEEMLASPVADIVERFEIFDEHGNPVSADDFPGRRVLAGEDSAEQYTRFRVRATGEERWSLTRSSAIRDATGVPQLAINVFHDVTERRRAVEERSFLVAREREAREEAEQLRREAEAERSRLRAVLQEMPAGVLIADVPSGRIVLRNGQVEQILRSPMAASMTVETYPGLPGYWPDGTPVTPGEWPLARACRGEVVEGEEIELVRGDGSRAYLRVSAVPVRGPYREIIAAVETFHDISTEKVTEARLGQLAAIVDSSDDAIISKTVDGTVLSWNPGAVRLYGYRPEEIIGKSVTTIFPPERLDEFRTITDKLKRGHRIEPYETTRLRKEGTEVDVSVSISPIRDMNGRLIGAATIARDISGRKQRERQQRFMAEASALLSSSLDYNTTLQQVAQLAVPHIADWCVVDIIGEDGHVHRLVAHSDPSKVEFAKQVEERYPPVDARPDSPLRTGASGYVPDITPEMLAATAQSPEHLDILLQLELRSGMAVPIVSRGEILGMITLLTGESGRRLSEEDLRLVEELARRAAISIDNAHLYQAERRALEDAQRALALREEFLSIASHELKTPLTALQLQLQLLERVMGRLQLEDDVTERVDITMTAASRQVRRLAKLVEDLLDVSRITAGKLHLELDQVDLAALAVDVVERFDPEIVAAGCSVSVHAPVQVVGKWDRFRLDQVVTNLLSNAIKYGRGEPIEVAVDGDDQSARLSVTDHGIGIDPEASTRIFERFERVVPVKNYGGLGLGLHIAREIVQAHGGTILVSSEPNQGATFTVLLPIAGPDADRDTGQGIH